MRQVVALSAAFVGSRVAFYACGLRFAASLDWMFLPDPADLQHNLWQTLLWFHAFPPGMALLAGALLKVGPLPVLAELFFGVSGLALMLSLHALLRRLVGGRWLPAVVAFAFAVSPPAVYLEKIFLYDQPAAALLCIAALLFVRALERSTSGRWLGFGLVLTTLGFLRSAFHPVWVIALLAVTALFVRVPLRHRALALVPIAALVGWVLKNAALFGFFGMTSWAPANLTAVTTHQLEDNERKAWIERGTLSRYAAISVFALPAEYGDRFDVPPGLPPQVTRLTRPSLGSGNFNHWLYLEVNRARGDDASAYLRERPGAWLMTALTTGAPQYFGPTTRWHPWDGRGGSHDDHHSVLGTYERAYVRLLHPFSPFGLYLVVPVVLVLAARKAWRIHQAGQRTAAALAAFCLVHVAALSTTGCFFALGENARYRFMVEPFLWLLTAFVLSRGPAEHRGDEGLGRVLPAGEPLPR